MINEEVMQICTNIGVHEGGMKNWVMDNAWVKFANIVAAQVYEECANIAMRVAFTTEPDDWALDKCNEIEQAILTRSKT